MSDARYVVDGEHPRAPSQALWDRLGEEARRQVSASLPSELPRAGPPEGDAHRIPKEKALSALDEYFRSMNRRVYLASELPIYYPDEEVFAPDLIAVLDVEPHERNSWLVSAEGRGLDFVLEIHVAGKATKDFEDNVASYARLGIPEYFAFDVPRRRLCGWILPPGCKSYEPILPQVGRWRSRVLELDLAIDGARLRFFHGSAALLDSRELIDRLSSMVDQIASRAEQEAQRAEQEAQRAEQEAQRAEQEAQRAEQEAQRAERLAARLRELGVDPDKLG